MATTISIGSGKGGTGKTMISANLAVLLAQTGRKVCLVDLDLGGADAHYLFGYLNPKRTLTDFLTRKVSDINEITHTLYSFNGLQLIPGTGNTLQTANLSYQEKQRLLRALDTIEADVLIFDIGAGTGFHALDFFMHAAIQICVTQPETAAIMDMYTFLQLATIRKILSAFLSTSEVAATVRNHQFNSLGDVFDLVEKTRPGSRTQAQECLRYFHPLLIINRSAASRMNVAKLRQMVTKYLAIEIPELGEIPDDRKMDEALKAFLPICELYPSADATIALRAIAKKLDKIIGLFETRQPAPQPSVAEAA